MSDSEEESFNFYGKPLEQYDEDSIPKRKPIAVEEQIATDDHGRRRFHGAFTGGFSAGFFNTVGSLEGWKPAEFKSSRSEKAERKLAKPEDFMDEEDMGEHGIAPQTIRATKDYFTSKKRKKTVFSEGPIPGIPVLHSLIEAGNETIGYLLMKNMDLRKKKDVLHSQDVSHEDQCKVYGCEMPRTYEIERNIENDDIIPNIFREYIKTPKSNTFGLGYVGLDKSELSLRKSTQLIVKDQNNRKLAISGQAFGVGAFENDDEDIYAKDDMSQYDFEITKEKKVKSENHNFNHPEFIKGSQLLNNKRYQLHTIPQSFSGKHKIRKSRFEPIPQEEDLKDKIEINRKDMNAAIRAKYFGEEVAGTSKDLFKETASDDTIKNKEEPKKNESVKIKQENPGFSNLIFDKFVSASVSENPHDILEKVEPTYTEHGTQEMRDAAKLKMYGPLTRVIIDWQPCSLVCKRFNVKEPVYDASKKDRIKKKNQIFFEYEKHKDEGLILKPESISTKDENNQDKGIEEKKSIVESHTEQIQEIKQPIKEIDLVNTLEISHESLSGNKTCDEPKRIQETDKIDVAKNIDLFKAVFLSSSESESEDELEQKSQEDNQDSNLMETITKTVLTEDLITKIKPRKEGILSNINFTPLSKPLETSYKEDQKINEDANVNKKEDMKESLLYGPALPALAEKTCHVYVPSKIDSKPVEEHWVEKDLIEKVQKHKKKHKKEKKKNKDKKHKKSKHRK